MKKLLILISLFLISFPALAMVTAQNASDLIGTWKVYDETNTELASIEIKIAVTKKGVSNFTYRTLGIEGSEDEELRGQMVNKNQIIFELLTVGESNTYLFEIDFTNGGGPGFLINNKIADCSVVGVDEDLVKKKFKKRLASSSQLCTRTDSETSILSSIKIVRDGIDPTTIASTASTPSEIAGDLSEVAESIEGAWKLKTSSKNNFRFLVKETETNFLGYNFSYRILNKKVKLKNLSESNFKSSERIGFILGDFLIVNSSFFNKKNSLSVIELGKKKKKGNGDFFKTPNGDCFPSKSGSLDTRVCTPNFDTSVTSSITTKNSKAAARRVNTRTKISF